MTYGEDKRTDRLTLDNSQDQTKGGRTTGNKVAKKADIGVNSRAHNSFASSVSFLMPHFSFLIPRVPSLASHSQRAVSWLSFLWVVGPAAEPPADLVAWLWVVTAAGGRISPYSAGEPYYNTPGHHVGRQRQARSTRP